MVITNYNLYCDRCKKEIAHSHISFIIKIKKFFHITKIMDSGYETELCNDCYKSYLEWFKEGGKNAEDHKAEA